MANHCNGLVDNTMKNGLQINLKDAIEDAGANVPDSACLWQYPEIIRKNLTAKAAADINLLGKDVINISASVEDSDIVYKISTSVNTEDLPRPKYADDHHNWGDEFSVDEVFDDLFKNILPKVSGVHAGDMTVTDGSGTDTKEWNNTLFEEKGLKTGLKPGSKYLRLYLTSQAEPIFIYIDSAVTDITNGFNVESSDTVKFTVDSENMIISAHINCITDEQINSLI